MILKKGKRDYKIKNITSAYSAQIYLPDDNIGFQIQFAPMNMVFDRRFKGLPRFMKVFKDGIQLWPVPNKAYKFFINTYGG